MTDEMTERGLRPAVRWSDLKAMAECPAMYAHVVANPKEPTTAMRCGTLVNRILLGKGPAGSAEIAVFDGAVRRGKAWDEFQQKHATDLIVTPAEIEKATAMANSVRRKGSAMEALDGDIETPLQWNVGGRRCVTGGVDVITKYGITELKTTQTSVHPQKFPWFARRMLYIGQLPWYRHGAEANGQTWSNHPDTGRPKHRIVAVNQQPPYLCQVFTMTESSLVEGEKMWRGWFELLLQCEANGSFPDYCETDVPLDLGEDSTTLTMPDGEELEVA